MQVEKEIIQEQYRNWGGYHRGSRNYVMLGPCSISL